MLNYSEEFIINEINELNLRSFNLTFYNVPEFNANHSADRLGHGTNLINNIIFSIINGNNNIKPIKVIRLRNRGLDNTRPIKVTFASSTNAFDILK